MKSMTGYAHRSYISEDYKVEVELKSYNSRFLEISHSISPHLQKYESKIDSLLKERFKRGHIDVIIRCKAYKSRVKYIVDDNLVESLSMAFRGICNTAMRLDISSDIHPKLSDYLSQEGVLAIEKDDGDDPYLSGLMEALEGAIEDLETERCREGEGTRESLFSLGDEVKSALKEIENKDSILEGHYRELLERKYRELTDKEAEDSILFMEELGVILVKYSINEEVSRLKVHLDEYFRLLDEKGPVGKRLDFISQEMNRECNTIASKSQLAEINLLVVKMKDAIENIREQVRNAE